MGSSDAAACRSASPARPSGERQPHERVDAQRAARKAGACQASSQAATAGAPPLRAPWNGG